MNNWLMQLVPDPFSIFLGRTVWPARLAMHRVWLTEGQTMTISKISTDTSQGEGN